MKEGKVSKGNYQGSQSLKINLDKSQIQNKIQIINKCQMSYIQITS